ncbi:MAG: MBL fold metallo-hydrolase [Kofleriaceae bacterium]
MAPHAPPPSAPTSQIDAIYAAARDAAGAVTEQVEIGLREVGPGARVVALATPTLPPATHTSCYLLGDGALTVVDPGRPTPASRPGWRRCSTPRRPPVGASRASCSPTTGDHVGGAAALAAATGVPVAAHADTAARLRGRVQVDELLADGDDLDGWTVVLTPGHAPGHVCLADAGSGQVVAGDLVAGLGTILIDPSEGDMTAYLASLERVAALAPRRLLPAHGPMIDDAVGRLRGYAAHRLGREARVLAAVTALGPAPPSALVPHAYADTPSGLWPLAERSLISHLVRLEALGQVRAEPAADGAATWRAA